MAERITDQLTDKVVNAMRRTLSGDLSTEQAARLIREAKEEAERLRGERAATYYGVPVAAITDAELAEAIAGTEKGKLR